MLFFYSSVLAQAPCKIIQICDSAQGCCITSIEEGHCDYYDVTLSVTDLSNVFSTLLVCGYGAVTLETGDQYGTTCLVPVFGKEPLQWQGYWSFSNADGCMNWGDRFNITCVE